MVLKLKGVHKKRIKKENRFTSECFHLPCNSVFWSKSNYLAGFFFAWAPAEKITRGRTDDDSHTKEKQDSLLVIVLQQWKERQKDPVEIDLN